MIELPIEPPEEELKQYYCPICGKPLVYDDQVYVDRKTGDVVACSNCTRSYDWYDYTEKLWGGE